MRKRQWPCPYVIRKSKEYLANKTGDMIAVDRYISCKTTTLNTLEGRISFREGNTSIDDGSEFEANLEKGCQGRDIKLFVLTLG